MTQRNDATQRQLDAARPDVSTWLAANAGSGKTRVLTDRVARLLLDGVQPQHILCLTYTKAAASEMQNRLFKRLGEWAMLPDDKLRRALEDLGVTAQTDTDGLRNARTLFARAIESPGGLKIQTIHSFCASLLRRFPLEAEVSPQFTEIEDRAADLLRSEIVDDMADGSDADVVQTLARDLSNTDFLSLTQEIVKKRSAFETQICEGDVLAALGQSRTLDTAGLEAFVFQDNEDALLTELAHYLAAHGSSADQKAAAALAEITRVSEATLPLLEPIFLNKSGANANLAKLGKFPTKASQSALAHLMPRLDALMGRVEQARDMRLCLDAARRTVALHNFARRFTTRYQTAKTQRGWLDFDDLIIKARALLNDPKVAAWVLFRIDGGIDHILVDEAQDTSPDQWDVIRRLTEEFSSGQGARADVERTLFVVGDKKQSIYSFQGADPREFDRMQAEFKQKFNDANTPFQETTLDYSFRSSTAVLSLVDRVFEGRAQAGFDESGHHIAFKTNLPGRVDIWPVIEPIKKDDDRVWYDPVDRRSEAHHSVVLAQQIAGQIKAMIDSGATIPDDGATPGTVVQRKVRAGDFLILVRRRGPVFSEIIRACKSYDLPIAGSDRLKVGAELAVRDLGALLSFLATQEDDLSLATALRSPLFGWSEQQVFDLAHKRSEKQLWEALRNISAEFPDTLAVLYDLRDNADFLRPFDLIERILTRHHGRARLLARLGSEVEDGINALLSQALAYERNAVPSLTGFLVWMKTDDLEIKRQIDSASDQIRVMTVHGSKGLEAPIVILPDTTKRDIKIRDNIVDVNAVALWKPNAPQTPNAMSAVLDDMKDAQRYEDLRLLYVAMTRAEKWLIVAAAGDTGKDGSSWYSTIDAAIGDAPQIELPDIGLIKRLEHADWTAAPIVASSYVMPSIPVLETYFDAKANRPNPIVRTVSPSDLHKSKALAGPENLPEDIAKAYGSLVHWHLENTAGAKPENHGLLSHAQQNEARAEAQMILNDPALAFVFDVTLAEVSVTAPVENMRIHGTIDRLIIRDTKITAVDFKTNRVVPSDAAACPTGIIVQMWAYAAALKQIYPDHEIETAILWTRTSKYMKLPHDLVFQTAKAAGYLDVSSAAK